MTPIRTGSQPGGNFQLHGGSTQAQTQTRAESSLRPAGIAHGIAELNEPRRHFRSSNGDVLPPATVSPIVGRLLKREAHSSAKEKAEAPETPPLSHLLHPTPAPTPAHTHTQ